MSEQFSQPVRGKMLNESALLLLEKGCSRQPQQCWADEYGTYATGFKDREGFPFLLVAKGSAIWKNIVSIHKNVVDAWNAPIVFAYAEDKNSEIRFYVLDPVHIRQTKAFENTRGSPMVNFKADEHMVYSWNGEESLLHVWEKVKKKRHEKLDYFGEN